MPGHILIPDQVGSQTRQGFDFERLFAQFGQPKQSLTGLAGFAAGPFGVPASLALGGLLEGFGSLIGGGGRRRRLRAAEGTAEEFLSSQVDESEIMQQLLLFNRADIGQVNADAGTAAQRVGLGSGIGQQFIQGRRSDRRSGNLLQLLQQAIAQRDRKRLAGAQLQGNLVNA